MDGGGENWMGEGVRIWMEEGVRIGWMEGVRIGWMEGVRIGWMEGVRTGAMRGGGKDRGWGENGSDEGRRRCCCWLWLLGRGALPLVARDPAGARELARPAGFEPATPRISKPVLYPAELRALSTGGRLQRAGHFAGGALIELFSPAPENGPRSAQGPP